MLLKLFEKLTLVQMGGLVVQRFCTELLHYRNTDANGKFREEDSALLLKRLLLRSCHLRFV